jgi:hypothetical protein
VCRRARWPEGSVTLVDTLSSIASVQGAPLPTGAPPDGVDVSAHWREGASPRRQQALHGGDGAFTVRSGRWMWVEGMPAPDPG